MGCSEMPPVSSTKKRALEALDKRFANAKAKISQEQQKSIPVSNYAEDGGSKKPSSLVDLPPNKLKACNTCTPMSSSQKDDEVAGPTYFPLIQPLIEKLQDSGVKLSCKRGNISERIIHELLRNGDSSQKYMQGSRSMKFDNWLLLDSFVQRHGSSTTANVRALGGHSKPSIKQFSMQKQYKHRSLSLPDNFRSFDLFKPMHELWKGYIIQLVKGIGKGQLAQCLLTADLHGAYFRVVVCKIASFVGTSGIMIRETMETFGIISPDNKFQVVPKKGSIFIFQAGCWKITLQGDQLSLRNGC